MKKYLFGLGAMLVGAGLMFVLMHGEVSADDVSQFKCTVEGVNMGNPSEYQASRDAMATQSPEQVSTSPSGGEVAQLNARIAELEAENATLSGQKSVSAIVAGDNVAELKSQLYTALNDLADADVSAFCTIDTHFLAKIKPEIFRSLCYRKKDGMWWKLYASDGVSCSEHKKNGTYRHSNCG